MATYAMGDLHGHLEVLHKIQAFLKPDDKVYFLGDACDRGPQPYECIKAIAEDPRFTYIKGNHEDMLVQAIRDYLDDGFMWDYQSYSLSAHNGGQATMDAWEWDPDRMKWYKYLRDLPTHVEYTNTLGMRILLSHAGYTPYWNDPDADEDKEIIIPDDHHLIWNRDDYFDPWDPLNEGGYDDFLVVHGHTPICYISEDLGVDWKSGPFWYADGHKVCLDTGGFFTGEFCLLDLDTYQSYSFFR